MKKINLKEVKKQLIEDIKDFLQERGIRRLEAVDVAVGDYPIIYPDCDGDDDGNFSLDRIIYEDGEIRVASSNWTSNMEEAIENIPIEAVSDIRVWLYEYEEEINETMELA